MGRSLKGWKGEIIIFIIIITVIVVIIIIAIIVCIGKRFAWMKKVDTDSNTGTSKDNLVLFYALKETIIYKYVIGLQNKNKSLNSHLTIFNSKFNRN